MESKEPKFESALATALFLGALVAGGCSVQYTATAGGQPWGQPPEASDESTNPTSNRDDELEALRGRLSERARRCMKQAGGELRSRPTVVDLDDPQSGQATGKLLDPKALNTCVSDAALLDGEPTDCRRLSEQTITWLPVDAGSILEVMTGREFSAVEHPKCATNLPTIVDELKRLQKQRQQLLDVGLWSTELHLRGVREFSRACYVSLSERLAQESAVLDARVAESEREAEQSKANQRSKAWLEDVLVECRQTLQNHCGGAPDGTLEPYVVDCTPECTKQIEAGVLDRIAKAKDTCLGEDERAKCEVALPGELPSVWSAELDACSKQCSTEKRCSQACERSCSSMNGSRRNDCEHTCNQFSCELQNKCVDACAAQCGSYAPNDCLNGCSERNRCFEGY